MSQLRDLWDGIKLGAAMLTGAAFLGAAIMTGICIPPGLGVSPDYAGFIFALHAIIGAIMGGAVWKFYQALRRSRAPRYQIGGEKICHKIPSWGAPPPPPA